MFQCLEWSENTSPAVCRYAADRRRQYVWADGPIDDVFTGFTAVPTAYSSHQELPTSYQTFVCPRLKASNSHGLWQAARCFDWTADTNKVISFEKWTREDSLIKVCPVFHQNCADPSSETYAVEQTFARFLLAAVSIFYDDISTVNIMPHAKIRAYNFLTASRSNGVESPLLLHGDFLRLVLFAKQFFLLYKAEIPLHSIGSD